MNLLTPSSGTIFWTLVTFAVLLFVLRRMAWKPLVDALDERENRIREALNKADEAQKNANKALADNQAMLDKARQEAQELIVKGKKTADSMRDELIRNARSEADTLLERAKKEITLERAKAVDEIKKLAVELSMASTQKIIGKALSSKEHEELIRQSLKDMGEIN